ncbi:MAG: DegV family protein [Firmicutes bacterium]|nr:DegV family protein [Bacillota bacterium]
MFTIVTDTSANLPTPMAKEAGLLVLPFTYTIDGKTYAAEDTEAFDGVSFYEKIRRGMLVTTSLINVQAYLDHFTSLAESGQDILFISMSSGISGSYNAAVVASRQIREEYPSVTIKTLDTMGASLGEGLIALHAAKLQKEGKSLEETYQSCRDMCLHMGQVFTVDSLMHLRRTGRCSNAKAAIGTVLNIKPLLKGNEMGQIVTYGQVRGRRKSLLALAKSYEEHVQDPENQTIGIAHADCIDDAVYLIRLLKQTKHPPKDVLTVMYEPVTGSHVGPGTLALFFLGNENVRSLKMPEI